MSSNLKEELKEVLQFADSLIELISEHHDIERLAHARQQLEIDRKRVDRCMKEAEERNRKLTTRKNELLQVEKKAMRCCLPVVNTDELTSEERTVYLKREEERALEKNRELEERILKMEKEELEEQHLKYVHDLQRSIVPVQFDEDVSENQIRGFIKKEVGNIHAFNYDTKTMSRDTVSQLLWSAV